MSKVDARQHALRWHPSYRIDTASTHLSDISGQASNSRTKLKLPRRRLDDAGLQRLARSFEARAELVTSDAELKALLEDAARELGFAFVGLVQHVSFRRTDPRLIHLDNYPEGWREEFVGEKLFLDDPVLQASVRTAKGFEWSKVSGLLAIRPRQAHVMERSVRYGMGSGFTIPHHIPGEPSGSCSFAVKRGRTLPSRHLRTAELIGIDAFHAARRLHGLPRIGTPIHLSRRELQCLRLVAGGKTDSEIADAIEEFGVEAARLYMKSVRHKYGVITRAQAIVLGLRDGHLSFDDAISPNG